MTIKTATSTVKGHVPLTAQEALTFLENARDRLVTIEIVDEHGNPVSVEQLRHAARR